MDKLLKKIYTEMTQIEHLRFYDLVKHLLADDKDIKTMQRLKLYHWMNNINHKRDFYGERYKEQQIDEALDYIFNNCLSERDLDLMGTYLKIHRNNFNVSGSKPHVKPEDLANNRKIVDDSTFPRTASTKISNIKRNARIGTFSKEVCSEILKLTNQEIYMHPLFEQCSVQGAPYKKDKKKGS